jgi:hypothetical protein
MLTPRLAAIALVVLAPAVSRAAPLDPYLPADTQSYVSVNVKQVLGSPLVKKYALEHAKQALKELDGANELLKELGFDPFKDLDRVIVSSPGAKEADRGLIILHGAFDAAKIDKKLTAMADDDEEAVKVHKAPLGGGVTHPIYEIKVPNREEALYASVASKQVLLVSPGKDYVVDALKQARAQKKVALKNKDLQGVIEKLDPKQSVSVALLGKSLAAALDETLPPALVRALKNVDVIGGGMTLNDEAKLDLVISTKDEASAKAMHGAIDRALRLAMVGLALVAEDNKGLGLLLEVVKTVKVSTKGKQVGLAGKLTADVLDDLLKKDE